MLMAATMHPKDPLPEFEVRIRFAYQSMVSTRIAASPPNSACRFSTAGTGVVN